MNNYKYKQVDKLLFIKLNCIDLIEYVYKYLLPSKKKSLIDNVKSCKKIDYSNISYYIKNKIYKGDLLECEISRCSVCSGIYNIRYIKERIYDKYYHKSVYKLLKIGCSYKKGCINLNINPLKTTKYFIHNCKI